jgi:hypothetical protein
LERKIIKEELAHNSKYPKETIPDIMNKTHFFQRQKRLHFNPLKTTKGTSSTWYKERKMTEKDMKGAYYDCVF